MAENGIGHFSPYFFFVTTYPFSASEYSAVFQRIVITQTFARNGCSHFQPAEQAAEQSLGWSAPARNPRDTA
jgi:hypothetical protein